MPPQRAAGRAPVEATEVAHLTTLAADVIDSLPEILPRALSDLKELDAVLSGALSHITTKLNSLLAIIHNDTASPRQRLELLKECAEDASAFKLGGEDKIRVATGTCETIIQHTQSLDLIVSLLTSLMPESLLETLPASTTPAGYPHLFPSYISAAFHSANGTTNSLAPPHPRAREMMFPPPPPTGSAMLSKQAQMAYHNAVDTVARYKTEGPLPSVRPVKRTALGNSNTQYEAVTSPMAATHKVSRKPSSHLTSNSHSSLPITTNNGKPKNTSTNASQEGYNNYTAFPTNYPKDRPSTRPPSQNVGRPPSRTKSTSDTMDLDAPEHNSSKDNGPEGSVNPVRAESPSTGSTSSNTRPNRNGSTSRKNTNEMSQDGPPSVPPNNASKRRQNSFASQFSNGNNLEEPVPSTTGRRGPKRKASQALESVENSPAIDALTENELGVPDVDQKDLTDVEEQRTYCYCHGPSYGEMIGCDGADCEREWFHLECAGLAAPPSGAWYCANCASRIEKKKRGL